MTQDTAKALESAPGERAISVDPEHFRIRLLVPVLTLVITVIVHLVGVRLLDAVLDDFSPLCIMLPLDLLVLVGAGTVVERALKRLMPSKRSAHLSDEKIILNDARHTPPDVREIVWDRMVNANAWYFVIKRRARVPKGWYCMAVHLLQDDTELIFYTFMSPKDAEELRSFHRFVRLRPRKEIETQNDLRQIATQRRLLKFEDARWIDGAEIASEDFVVLLGFMESSVPAWA